MNKIHAIAGTKDMGASRDFCNMFKTDMIYNLYEQYWRLLGYRHDSHHPSTIKRRNLEQFQL